MKDKWVRVKILVAIFVLFVPNLVVNAAPKTIPITLTVAPITSKSDLDKLERAGSDVGKSVTFTKEGAKIFKISASEDGILYFNISSNALSESVCDGFDVRLYSDQDCTKGLGASRFVVDASPESIAMEVKAGTYWLKAQPHMVLTTEFNTKLTIYAGLVPSKNILNIKKSTEEKTKKVVLSIKPMKGYTKLQVRDQDVRADEMDGSTQGNEMWDREGIEFANEQYEVIKNGVYTFRVVDSMGNSFFDKIKITNVDRTAPKKPSVQGNISNSYVVKGKGEKGAMAFVKIGTKTYKSKVAVDGTFLVNTPLLEKGKTVKVYLKDAAGNSSEELVIQIK